MIQMKWVMKMMFLEGDAWYNELQELIGIRTVQVILFSLLSMLFCQFLKVIIFSIKEKKLMIKALFTTGGMPSSHTATVITLVVLMGFFQMSDSGKLEYSFAVALIFACIVIHDAMGVRLEASKHAQILNNLVKNEDEQTRIELGFGKKGKLKELLGHKAFEVVGGIIVGLIFAIVGYFCFA